MALGDRRRPARVARRAGRRTRRGTRRRRPRAAELGLELLERGHERLGRVPAAVLAETAEPDRLGSRRFAGARRCRAADGDRDFGRGADIRRIVRGGLRPAASAVDSVDLPVPRAGSTPAISSTVRSIARLRSSAIVATSAAASAPLAIDESPELARVLAPGRGPRRRSTRRHPTGARGGSRRRRSRESARRPGGCASPPRRALGEPPVEHLARSGSRVSRRE